MPPFSLKERILQRNASDRKQDFYQYIDQMKEELKRELELQPNYADLNAKAIAGDPEAVSYFLYEIEKYIRKKPFSGMVPPVYENFIEGCFHEWKGFGPAYRWFLDRRYSDSSGLQIISTQIFYMWKGKYRSYPFSMHSPERVEQLQRTLLRNAERVTVDHSKPSGEFKMLDPLWPGRFIRVAVWVHPRVWEGFTTITLRRQIVEHLTIDEQAGTGSIPHESIQMLRHLFAGYFNTIVAGPVGSGKSTFANTMVGEQLKQARDACGVVMIEKHPESILPYVMKGHRIIPIQAEDEELMQVGIESLRHDPVIIYMTEMRYHEWEFFHFAGEKGYKGLVGTFHTTDPEDIPYQGATAVYKKQGGNLKGHMMSGLKSCEFVIIMESLEDGTKRLMRISEIQYDENSQTVYANDIMRWNQESSCWEYNDQLHPDTWMKFEKKDPIAASAFQKELRKLAAGKPMKNPKKESIRSQLVLRD